jgi:plasmid maintenance system antidote protein VapI
MSTSKSAYKITEPAEMTVKLPPLDRPPGCFLRDVVLPEYGMTNVADLARRLGVNRPNLVNVLAGTSAVSRELAYRLGALLNDHVADLLIAYQHAWDLQSEAPRREAVKAEVERVAAPAAD